MKLQVHSMIGSRHSFKSSHKVAVEFKSNLSVANQSKQNLQISIMLSMTKNAAVYGWGKNRDIIFAERARFV